MNENYEQPSMPEGVEEGIRRGLYLFRKGGNHSLRVNLMGSGTIFREVIAAAEILEADYGVSVDIWSATSFNELRRDGLAVDRWNRLHPEGEAKTAYVSQCLGGEDIPTVAASDYMKVFADQIRNWVPGPYYTLGTDGYGRSDTRQALRAFFEVDRRHVVQTTLKALCDQGKIEPQKVTEAMSSLDINAEDPDPTTV